MTKEYAFDVKMFSVVRVKAEDEEAARMLLDEYLQAVDINVHIFVGDEDRIHITEASMDGEADLVEVDGVQHEED
jgi:hypothetical protein